MSLPWTCSTHFNCSWSDWLHPRETLFFHTRRLLNILFSPPSDSPEIIGSLDAGKAFDRVVWSYLLSVLQTLTILYLQAIFMVILPKFLYLFQHLLICMNKSFFNGFDGLLCLFLWGNKPARLKKSILRLPKAKGSLALPNFQQYYWACNIHKLLFWNRDSYSDNCPPWVHKETSLTKSSLYSIVCSQLALVLPKSQIIQ